MSLSSFEESEGLLRITGELDNLALQPFGEHLESFVAKATGDLEIDICDIRYVTSSFIGYLARALVDAKAKGCIISIRTNDRVARLLKIAGIDRLAPLLIGEPDA
jgi:anti-anti-sigma factor